MNMLEQGLTSDTDKNRVISDEKPRLLTFISSRIKDRSTTEDIFQEAVEKTLRRCSEGFPPTDIIHYLYRVVINLINDHHRLSDNPFPDFVNIDEEPDLLCDKPLPDHDAEMKEKMELFFKCLQNLPPESASMLVMQRIHGLSASEIARRTGKNPKAVEKRIDRAIRSIQEQIDRGVESPGRRK